MRAYEFLVLLLGVRYIWHVLQAPAGAGDGQKDIGNVARRSQAVAARPSHSAHLHEDWPRSRCQRPLAQPLPNGSQAPDDDGGVFPLVREEPAGDVEAMLGSSEGGARAPEVAQEGCSCAILECSAWISATAQTGPPCNVRTLARLACMTAKSCGQHQPSHDS